MCLCYDKKIWKSKYLDDDDDADDDYREIITVVSVYQISFFFWKKNLFKSKINRVKLLFNQVKQVF